MILADCVKEILARLDRETAVQAELQLREALDRHPAPDDWPLTDLDGLAELRQFERMPQFDAWLARVDVNGYPDYF